MLNEIRPDSEEPVDLEIAYVVLRIINPLLTWLCRFDWLSDVDFFFTMYFVN